MYPIILVFIIFRTLPVKIEERSENSSKRKLIEPRIEVNRCRYLRGFRNTYKTLETDSYIELKILGNTFKHLGFL